MVRLQHRAALVLLCLLANAVAYLHPPPEEAERWNARAYQGMVSPRGRTAREPGEGGGGAANQTRRRLRPITLKQVAHPRPLVLLACCPGATSRYGAFQVAPLLLTKVCAPSRCLWCSAL